MKEHHKQKPKPSHKARETKGVGAQSAYENDSNIKSTDIRNANAAGIGAIERSDENKIEKLSYEETGNDEDVY